MLRRPFYNEVLAKIDAKYFPEIKWHHENSQCGKIHYKVECLSNGVIGYQDAIKAIAKLCNTTKEEIDSLFEEFIEQE